MEQWLAKIDANEVNKELEFIDDELQLILSIENSVLEYNSSWREEEITDTDFTFLVIHIIEIEEEHRNKKLGTKIMNTLINYARDNKINRICLLVDAMQESEFNLTNWYSKFGFKHAGGELTMLSWHVLKL